MALIGDTIILELEFKNEKDEYVEMTNPYIKIYDGAKEIIHEADLTELNKIQTGFYRYTYTIPVGPEEALTVEWGGMYNQKPWLDRDDQQLSRLWVRPPVIY